MTTHLMIDLETLGTRPGAVVVEVGLVLFRAGCSCEESKLVRVDVQSCLDCGMKVDAATLWWWAEQCDEARRAVFSVVPGDGRPAPVSVKLAAHQIHDAITGAGAAGVWANGASFDLPILAELFYRAHLDVPWDFRRERCYRTVNAMFPDFPKLTFGGVCHSSLDDAKYQAARLVQLNEKHPAILGDA